LVVRRAACAPTSPPTGKDGDVAPPEDAWAFGQEVGAVVRSVVANDFVGAYFVGSIALGGYVAGESDLDIVAVCRERLSDDTKHAVADHLLEATIRCPARGLEFTLYRAEVALCPSSHADFEVNVNGGPRMDRSVHPVARDEPAFGTYSIGL
jgi:hypothetical protein